MSQFTGGRALVIGVANYPNVNKLPQAVLNDARAMESLLLSEDYCVYPPGQVTCLLDNEATLERICAELAKLAADSHAGDTAIVFFSGHGGRSLDSSENTYLIPYDCDPHRLKETAISGTQMTALLSKVKAARLVVILDACHSAGAGNVKKAIDPVPALKAGVDDKLLAELGRGAGRVVMASSRTDEVSVIQGGMDNSLFTHHLLGALKGEAGSKKGMIGVFDVFTYVSDKVPIDQPDQHPIFKAEMLETNFPLALFRGGKDAVVTKPKPALSRRPEHLGGQIQLKLMD